MGRQSKLVLLLLLSVGTLQVALTSTPHTLHIVHDNVPDDKLVLAEALPEVAEHIKLNTVVKDMPSASDTKSSADISSTTTTHKPVSDEILNDLIEASKHSVALADDPRFNKMLPEKFKLENSTTNNKSEESYDDYEDNYDYDDDYNYDEETTTEKLRTSTTSVPKLLENDKNKRVEMKPIKDPKSKNTHATHANILDQSNDIDNDDDTDEDDYNNTEDDIADEEEIVFNENVPCPRYCVCARNINSYLVATCSRFDRGTQKFGSDITDLIVTDVGPKYPILLGPDFFLHMGLKRVSSIKIANCTIEYLHPEAFNGLDELYSVNLTNVGLAIINPDTFANNKKLRMLTISGNDLSVMSSVHYLLNSSTIEELDLSRNHLTELNPNAFTKLSNIVYINLSQNDLQKIPEHVFDAVETIEELDLSLNNLKTLPAAIFNRTALAILSLRYNSITGDLHFGTSDLQQLDLSFNSMNQIHHGMFDKMTGLTNLNLKGNGITKIQPDSFLTLKNLRHIDLSINELDQVSSMIFYKNSELDVIRLNDNPKLSQLPTDGFLSYNGYFTVYFLDISNCAIGALGHKTFSTMPHLATLKLAWNNINNLERDTFASLKKLIDLDLSNNLIAKLDELTFMNNNDVVKLNLAGNPIRKLSVRLFLPLSKLRELDVSDCELSSLLTDNQFGVGRKYKFYDTLRSFNASANQIKRVSSSDIKNFKFLRTLDISHNPLKCNEDFQDFISYVSLNTNMVPSKIPTLANIENSVTYVKFQSQAGWAELAHEVCKHHESMAKSKEEKLENRIDLADKDLDEDAKNLLNIMENSKQNKMQKILKDSDKDTIAIDEHSTDSADVSEHVVDKELKDDDAEENDYNNEDEDEDEDDDDDDEEDDEKDYDADSKETIRHSDDALGLSKETKDKWTKYVLNGNEKESDVDEEIIIEHGRVYYSGYKFLLPIAIVVSCVVVILLALAKMVSVVMRKRGERYRMALLASSKNSIVYQKLTEDIKPTHIKDTKPPKVHQYAPINQV